MDGAKAGVYNGGRFTLRRKTTFALIFCALCLFPGLNSLAQVTVGEYAEKEISTPHPYPKPGTDALKMIFTQDIFHPESTYIAIHFARLDLAPGDVLVVRSPDGSQYWEYKNKGRRDLGVHPDGFFATHIKGEIAVIELFAMGDEPGYGFDIDFYGRGYSDRELSELWALGYGETLNLAEPGGEHRSICTADDTEEIKCYQNTEPELYEESRSVIRLLQNGATHCTGWLIGCDGHVMTNEHCIGSQGQLNNIDFEFMAEGPDCATNCGTRGACGGTIEASGGTLVQVDAPLDFALVIPDTSTASSTDLPATYGYMELRASGPELGEQIYIPQHPAGWGKRVAFQSSYPGDNGLANVFSLNEQGCSGGPDDVGYFADTQGGSSGSPVLGYSDHRVVALHHCRGSSRCTSGNSNSDDPNRGVPITAIIAALGSNLPNCTVCPTIAEPTNLMGANNGDNRVDLTWSAPVTDGGGVVYNVYRSESDCASANYELIAEAVSETNFSDTTVSGGTTYSYTITVNEVAISCESVRSNCIEVTATGSCILLPTFQGVDMVTNAAASTCEISLSWNTGTARCGTDVVYNVYRDTTDNFTPGAGNLLASGLTGSTYQDVMVDSGTRYYYMVRAEDNSGNGSGPHASGNEDSNTVIMSAVPTGPDAVSFEDDLESGTGNWTATAGPGDPGGTSSWTLTTAQSNSPSNSWFASDEATVKDQVMATSNGIALPANPAKLSFWHRFNTELNWDGGVLEYSVDGGTTWLDILAGDGNSIPANENRFISGGYVSALRNGQNPISGRAAWHGDNSAFEKVVVDLADMANQTIHLRWRLGCDQAVGDDGWYVDDITVAIGSNCNFECVYDEMLPLWPQVSILDMMGCLPEPLFSP